MAVKPVNGIGEQGKNTASIGSLAAQATSIRLSPVTKAICQIPLPRVLDGHDAGVFDLPLAEHEVGHLLDRRIHVSHQRQPGDDAFELHPEEPADARGQELAEQVEHQQKQRTGTPA